MVGSTLDDSLHEQPHAQYHADLAGDDDDVHHEHEHYDAVCLGDLNCQHVCEPLS